MLPYEWLNALARMEEIQRMTNQEPQSQLTIELISDIDQKIHSTGPFLRDLRGIYTLWLRDVIRLWRDRIRLVGSFIQPLLFLFVLGGGLRGRVVPQGSGTNYQIFIFPGIVLMSILFTSSFAGMAVVWDREMGFLKEVLVAPISRTAVVVGKILGGASNSLIQGIFLLALAPFLKIYPSFGQIFFMLGVMLIVSLSQTAMGIALSARMSSSQGFMVLMNFIVLPIYFLSGAMFPLNQLPTWLSVLSQMDPLTYGVDLMRGILLGTFYYSVYRDIFIIMFFGLLMLYISVRQFQKD
ncbi:MAG: ABC transporter permease [Nitrospiraceae bacterium]|nr:ABC transporter permease [Nitrospiraceae bacterium]